MFITDTDALRIEMAKRKMYRISDLARASGVERSLLGKILNGRIQPSEKTKYALINALHLEPDDVIRIFMNRAE